MALRRHKSSFDDSTNYISIEEPAATQMKQSQDEKSSTEEFRDDVNVLWDYNSPQSKAKSLERKSSRMKSKLERNIMSPKVPLRRHLSDNDKQLIKQDFSKLREEMKALKAALANLDNETSLVMSPREERFYKMDLDEPPPDDFEDLMDFDPFDDNMDDKLLTFSQQVLENPSTNCDNDRTNVLLQDSEVFNDSFDAAMGNMDSEYLEQVTQVVDIKIKKYTDIGDDANEKSRTSLPSSTASSFAHCSSEQSRKNCVESFHSDKNSEFSKEKLQEIIEKKRLEALAKLEANKKRLNPIKTPETASTVTIAPHTTPEKEPVNFYCDNESEFSREKLQEIIEKKRLEALAKLEANKKRLDPIKILQTVSTVTVPSHCSPEKKPVNSYYDNKSQFSKEKLQEIEKKRLEALAKLEAKKRRLDPNKSPEIATTLTEPLHCTPEKKHEVRNFYSDNKSDEIEKKRLEALAKLIATKKRLEPNKSPEIATTVILHHCSQEKKHACNFYSDNKSEFSKEKLQEIEKKRLEALAKLEANKRRLEPVKIPETTSSSCSNSPFHCTPEEIEKKRLEALAKRDAKRQLEIIEKNKQQALKRREESQKKMRPK